MLDPTTQALEDQIAGRQQLRAEIKRLRALVEGACAALDDTGNELARARATEILRAAGVDLSKRACDPVGACESHGRCWTHSEWEKASDRRAGNIACNAKHPAPACSDPRCWIDHPECWKHLREKGQEAK